MDNSCNCCHREFNNDVKEGIYPTTYPVNGRYHIPSGYCIECMEKKFVKDIMFDKFLRMTENIKKRNKKKTNN